MPKRGRNEQNSYAVDPIVKRTAGHTENQGSWPQADRQHVVWLFPQQSGNIITEARRYSTDLATIGQTLEVPCTLRFFGDAKLGRSCKLC